MKVDEALETYLQTEILPRLAQPPYGRLAATRLSQKMPVLLWRDDVSQAKLVSKAYQYGQIPLDTAWERAEKEYRLLKLVRERFGMGEGDFRVVEPLGTNKALSALLVVEYGKGKTLDHYIKNAIHKQETDKLYYKLRYLARFLVKLHRNSQTERHPTPEIPRKYLKKLIHELQDSILSEKEGDHLKTLASPWWARTEVFEDSEVLVHGDATPTNFLFRHDKVTGIDLEKAKWADCCWDLGFLAAELKHHFLNENRSSWDSEPFIRHFLLEYAACFRDPDMFHAITHRLPLYMALGLLRIARNTWLGARQRLLLVDEARACLKYKPGP
jgi:thiamine kinase-like enzyme